MSFWKNVADVLEIAGAAVALNRVNEWVNQKVLELRSESTQINALVDIAHFVGSLNNDEWQTYISGLRLKALNNPEVDKIREYSEMVVTVELNDFKQLLGMNPQHASTVLLNIVEHNPLQRCIYIGLLLSRNRDVMASYLLNAIIDTAHRRESIQRKVASGKINKMWTEHNITHGNEKGMYIHLDFNIHHSEHDNCSAIAWFYYANGQRLEDVNGRYHTSDGQVCTWEDFVPQYENTRFHDLKMFMPYAEFDLYETGNYKLKFCVGLFNNNDRLDITDYDHINYTIG